MAPNKKVIQHHHLIYASGEHHQEEVVEALYKGEHFVMTLLNRRKNISKGLIKSLKLWMLLNEDKAIELNKEKIEGKENENE